MENNKGKTIYSLVTKPINQNVAIIRISGPEAFGAAELFVEDFHPKQNNVEYKKLKHNDVFIDDALVLTFIKPNSFTGENVIELQTHGSMFVVEKIITILNKNNFVQSDPGEFMRQAYMNGKMDLTQTEAINTLILSENKKLAETSLENLNGKQFNFINTSLEKIGDVVSRIQVSIDYPENTDLPEYNMKSIGESVVKLKNEIEKIIDDSQRLINYSKGIRIALVGMPNVGKSTLLNNLSRENKAIVSDIEGTTRDVVDSIIYLDGLKTTLHDTAGIRSETDDPIEKEGINRSLKMIDESNIVLLLLDGTKDLVEQRNFFKTIFEKHNNKIIEVITKSDLVKNEGININQDNSSLTPLMDKISSFIKSNVFDEKNDTNTLLVTQNQIDNFNKIISSLNSAITYINLDETPDVVAFELEQSMKELGKILGLEIDQNYLTNLFANFCIGK